MAKFDIFFTLTGSAKRTIEADNLDEAVRLACLELDNGDTQKWKFNNENIIEFDEFTYEYDNYMKGNNFSKENRMEYDSNLP